MGVVLDAWALMAVLQGEPAGLRVVDVIDRGGCAMNWINVGEVYYTLARRFDDERARTAVTFARANLELVAPTESLVLAAGGLKAHYRLSYADAFAAATAIARGDELWTGDPELLIASAPWRTVDLR